MTIHRVKVKLNGNDFYEVTCPFGSTDPLHPYGHKGIDLAIPEGTELFSPTNGVIERIVDQGGSLIMGVSHKRRISQTKKVIRGEEYIFRSLPSNYYHTHGINQLEVETMLFCEETGNEIVTWDIEKGRTFTYQGNRITVIPDVFCVIQFKVKKFFAYIEYDTGSENLRYKTNFPIINDKLEKYKKYKSSKLWIDYAEYFPVILFATEDEKRIDYFNKKSKEYKLQGFGIYHDKYTDFIRHSESIL